MYPRTYFAMLRPAPTPGTAFVAMPFAAAFVPIYRTIKRALDAEKIRYTRVDEVLGGQSIIEDILDGLASSDFVVADVTGRNPNVFYELGIAHMSKPAEKVLLLAQDAESIPFDLRPYRHIIYSPTRTGLQKLTDDLRRAIRAVATPVHRIELNADGRGRIGDKLMAQDHCLYDFEITDSFSGRGSSKFRLVVTRHSMGKHAQQEVVFDQGMGLMQGQERLIRGTPWSISLERKDDINGTAYVIQPVDLPKKSNARGRI